jgi:hypothetical protein
MTQLLKNSLFKGFKIKMESIHTTFKYRNNRSCPNKYMLNMTQLLKNSLFKGFKIKMESIHTTFKYRNNWLYPNKWL